jgi:hypothetical protein
MSLDGECFPKREEVTEGWSKSHNEELHNLRSLPNITWVIKSRRQLLAYECKILV